MASWMSTLPLTSMSLHQGAGGEAAFAYLGF
jgi:hypothetical protein